MKTEKSFRHFKYWHETISVRWVRWVIKICFTAGDGCMIQTIQLKDIYKKMICMYIYTYMMLSVWIFWVIPLNCYYYWNPFISFVVTFDLLWPFGVKYDLLNLISLFFYPSFIETFFCVWLFEKFLSEMILRMDKRYLLVWKLFILFNIF